MGKQDTTGHAQLLSRKTIPAKWISSMGKHTTNDQRYFHYSEEHHGKEWKKIAGIPPMLYPTHSTSMILGCLPGVYVKLSAFDAEKYLFDIFDGKTKLAGEIHSPIPPCCANSNGGIARISENRRLAFAKLVHLPILWLGRLLRIRCPTPLLHPLTRTTRKTPDGRSLMNSKSVTAILNEPGTPENQRPNGILGKCAKATH